MQGKQKITITEQDVFDYIFFPDSLAPVKKDAIKTDYDLTELLDFYQSLKDNLEKPLEPLLEKKIANLIPEYTLVNVIHLIEVKLAATTKSISRLAAASKELFPQIFTKTFMDRNKEYLIKILNYNNMSKIFVFSTKDEVVTNFDIVIEPNSLCYHFENNSEPLEIHQFIPVESIRLEILPRK